MARCGVAGVRASAAWPKKAKEGECCAGFCGGSRPRLTTEKKGSESPPGQLSRSTKLAADKMQTSMQM
eukprot:1458785-Prymnesium_polylepis.2